jgi:probable F420-dependent oxidoreductase
MARLLRFGVYLPAYMLPDEPPPNVAFLQDFARRAEDLGFDSLWVVDHLFESPPSYRAVFMEPISSLALVTAATRRITLGTGILILPLRDPVVTAKAVATLDVASGGRIILGVGVGWDEREYRACQVPKATRGQRMDEMLAIMTGLWTEGIFSYQGRFFLIPEICLLPKPVQRPHPPIWIAGGTVPAGTSKHITQSKGYTAERAMQRAGRVGYGFITAYRSCPGMDMSCLVESWTLVCREARAAGRDPARIRFAHQDHLHIDLGATPARLRSVLARFSHNPYETTAPIYLMGKPEDLIPRIQARIDAGVEELIFNLLTPDPNQLDLFMKHVRPHLRPREGPPQTSPTLNSDDLATR